MNGFPLRTKIRLVVEQARSPSNPMVIRVIYLYGLLCLLVLPVAATREAWRLPRLDVQSSLVGVTCCVVMAIAWGYAWRRAVDVPMGEAWWKMKVVARSLCACWGVLFVVNLTLGDWIDAAGALVGLIVFWGHGGGDWGWDDVPVPDPAPGGASA